MKVLYYNSQLKLYQSNVWWGKYVYILLYIVYVVFASQPIPYVLKRNVLFDKWPQGEKRDWLWAVVNSSLGEGVVPSVLKEA